MRPATSTKSSPGRPEPDSGRHGRASKGGSPCNTTLRLVPVPRLAWLLVIVGLIAALGAAALLVGSRSRLPAPFGPAANGSIVYGTESGDILAYDPVSGTSSSIIAGTTKDETPDFSPDGTKFLFARETEDANRWLLMVADADGSDIRPLTGPLFPDWNAWSPDSAASCRGRYGPGSRHPLDLRPRWKRSAEPPARRPHAGPGPVAVGDRARLPLAGRARPIGLYAISIDGSAAPAAPAANAPSDTDWLQPVLSPDGTRLVWTKWVDGRPVIHVIDIASGKVSTPVFSGTNEGDGWPTWSPDGTKLLFSRWDGIGEPSGGGPGRPVATSSRWGRASRTSPTGPSGSFSPDGTRIVARYGYDPLATWLLDPIAGGRWRAPPDRRLRRSQLAAPGALTAHQSHETAGPLRGAGRRLRHRRCTVVTVALDRRRSGVAGPRQEGPSQAGEAELVRRRTQVRAPQGRSARASN